MKKSLPPHKLLPRLVNHSENVTMCHSGHGILSQSTCDGVQRILPCCWCCWQRTTCCQLWREVRNQPKDHVNHMYIIISCMRSIVTTLGSIEYPGCYFFHSLKKHNIRPLDKSAIRVRDQKLIFLFPSQNICCGYSKEQS